MSAHYSDPETRIVSSSQSWSKVFGVSLSSPNSFQIAKATTGTLTAVTLEGNNTATNLAEARALPNRAWFPIPEFSGTLLTGSAGASIGFNFDNLNCRFARVVLTVGNADTFTLAWHGKGD